MKENYEFWRKWKRKNKLEEAAIESLKVGKNIILKNIPKKEIIAIYIKGSFIRRELNEKSDVDFVTILKTGKYVRVLRELENKYKGKVYPEIQIRPAYSINELKNGKIRRKTHSTPPYRFVKHLKHYKIIYGKALSREGLFIRTNEKDITGLIKNLLNKYILEFEKKENGDKIKENIGLSGIIKQVFWITELELSIKGINHKHSFKEINNSIKDRGHIIHEAYKLRIHPTKDKKIRKEFITKLKRHLINLLKEGKK